MLIEKKRTDINKSYKNSVLSGDVTVRKSQKLDELLNQYNRFTKS
ncbi:aspartyl-phosphate phosphatase Spo0E family protein [Candidatus Contubernalis alkalaceticus]